MWPGCFQVLGLLVKELKIRAHPDLQKKPENFIWSKEIVQIQERYTVKIDKEPREQGY